MNFFKQLISSSQNPDQLSLTVKGVMGTVVGVAGVLLKLVGHQIDDASLQQIADTIANIVMSLAAVVSGVTMVWGLVRKFIPSKPAAIPQ